MRAHYDRARANRNENFPVASWLIDPRHRAPILAFYNFVRTADDIADHATLRRRRSSRCSIASDAGLTGHDDTDAAAVRLRAALAERKLAAKARSGPACRVQTGRHQAALPRLGRSDRLLRAVGDAGRPFRARRSRREPRHLAGQRCAVRGIADHQSSARLQGGLSETSIASTCRRTRCGERDECRSARRATPPRCSFFIACTRLPARTERLLAESDVFAALNRRLAAWSRSFRHQHAGPPVDATPDAARSIE